MRIIVGANIVFSGILKSDGKILEAARASAVQILESDPELSNPEHLALGVFMKNWKESSVDWSKVS